ncbi:Cell wall-associated hydrolase (invasion-associated protein) [Candidatus Burkholderia verschuerenii]|uniref:Cell wall-associated hydrolase (Invasion-associated protein) n=1 Tax=Candidatus Burkholderia verschuerenii TaxID=242163 RepID=A0A0L0MH41_9BURK|nr:C40 family peptidase [Candidatus Burkholderia verschuerenii]KND61600.1 Cell wall-associated hydrolase (invasion-associated protein) [Candidatus Burkholderia verschuerenii]
MRRIWLPLLVTVLLAACDSAPQQATRKPSASTNATRTYKPPPGFPTFVDHSIGREEISIQAMALVGVPYRWGGNNPDAGFDCSGLVRYVVDRAASVDLPRTTAEMSGRGESIEPDEIAPGDLVFFNTTGRPHSHVGIYVGKLRFVNAPSTGGTVRLDYLMNPYWAKHFDGIRRVAPPKFAPTPFDAPTYIASPAPAPAPAPAAAPMTPPAPATADAFEPPPSSSLSAAQRQAKAAGASAPATAAINASSDPIQAAADAFEPPPSSRSAAQQQARTAHDDPPARVMRASTSSLTPARPAASNGDDPIARFANGSN